VDPRAGLDDMEKLKCIYIGFFILICLHGKFNVHNSSGPFDIATKLQNIKFMQSQFCCFTKYIGASCCVANVSLYK
jgi:hypothetical protein